MKQKTAQILAISSGKGGVGKTSLAVNTGIMLSKMGHRVCLFDADINLANINIMLKVVPAFTLEHVLSGEKDIRDIAINVSGISLIAGASGVTDFNNLELTQQHRLIRAISTLEKEYDYILVDTAAGIHDNVLAFIESAHQCVLLISPEPTSLTDAFSLVRVLNKRGYKKRFNVVVNSTTSELAARKTYKRFSMAVAKFIGCKVAYLGFVVKDEQLAEAICLQSPVTISQPSALSSRCFNRLAQTISMLTTRMPVDKGLSSLWQNELSTQLPEFGNVTEVETGRHQYIADTSSTKRQLIVDHKHAVLDYIDAADMSREEVDGMMTSFIDAYVRRFDSYPVDTIKALNHSLELNRISQKDINNLLSSLQLFYKEEFSGEDKDSSAQYLCQLINSFVEQHKSFPFDPVYTLYRSLDMGDIENSQIGHLLITLNLIYQGKNIDPEELKNLAQNMIYCAERNTSQLKELTELLQKKYLIALEKTIVQKGVDEKPLQSAVASNNAAKSRQLESAALLDSIRYASLIE